MRKLLNSLLVAVLLTVAYACKEDAKDYPPVLTDFADVAIGTGGVLMSFATDDGTLRDVSQQGISANIEDTVVRGVVTYTIDGAATTLYGLQPVFAEDALPLDSFKNVAYDPVSISSLWKTPRYVNMILGIKTSGVEKSHAFAFCQDSIGHVSLLHARSDRDNESYTERVYMSLPIYNNMYARDSLTLRINTYDGMREFPFRK